MGKGRGSLVGCGSEVHYVWSDRFVVVFCRTAILCSRKIYSVTWKVIRVGSTNRGRWLYQGHFGEKNSCRLDFKLSPCSLCSVFPFGYFPGVWGLKADVSEPSIGSIFLGRWRKNNSGWDVSVYLYSEGMWQGSGRTNRKRVTGRGGWMHNR